MSPTDHTQETAQQAVLGNFELTAQLPQGKSLRVSGYIFSGESADSLNQRIDTLHDVIDRQRTRAEIPELEVKLEQAIKRLEEIRGHYAALLEIKAKGGKLTAQQKQALEVMDINVTKHAEDIDKGRAAVAEARAKVGLA